MQSNYRSNFGTFGYWLSELRKIGKISAFDILCLYRTCVDNEMLKFQTLSHCELITDDGIRQLAAGICAAESLSVLELDNCPLITDQTLEHLVSCHNLERIELYDCQMITRAAIRRLRVNTKLYYKYKVVFFFGHDNFYRKIFYFFILLNSQNHLPNIKVHAYFAPVTPPPTTSGARPRYCRCCEILWEEAVGLARKILCRNHENNDGNL